MACEFSIPFSISAEDVLAKAEKAVQGQGGNFNGDVSGGHFDVSVFGNKIIGNYSISAQTMTIKITDKPFLIPCGTIEGFLKNQIT